MFDHMKVVRDYFYFQSLFWLIFGPMMAFVCLYLYGIKGMLGSICVSAMFCIIMWAGRLYTKDL